MENVCWSNVDRSNVLQPIPRRPLTAIFVLSTFIDLKMDVCVFDALKFCEQPKLYFLCIINASSEKLAEKTCL